MNCSDLDIIVLTYNRAQYLEIMLESLCNQTATGFNIKVLNNASTDNTIDVIKNIKKKYPDRNIEIITNEINLGNFGNFKKSQELANNTYTAVFHDDDAIHPEYINTAMCLLRKHPETIMCSSNCEPLCNVSNYNWYPLNKNYYIYPQNDGVYLHMLLDRPSFASDIYKTEYYKKIPYKTEQYGKLHDIIFMFEMNSLGSMICIQGSGIRYRIAPTCDSNNFTNGPFPKEVLAVISRINELNTYHKFYGKYLLYNFALMLYRWSYLEAHISEKEFLMVLQKNKTISKFEQICFTNPFIKKFFKLSTKIRKKAYKHKIKHIYSKRI